MVDLKKRWDIINVIGTNNTKSTIKHTTKSVIRCFKYNIIHFNPLTREA